MRTFEVTPLLSTSALQRKDLFHKSLSSRQAASQNVLATRLSTPVCRAENGNYLHLNASEPYRGPNNPVTGYRVSPLQPCSIPLTAYVEGLQIIAEISRGTFQQATAAYFLLPRRIGSQGVG